MLLMSHTAMGILAYSINGDPIIGSSLSFLSHYVLDIIPHEPKSELFYVPPQKSCWTQEIKDKLQNRKKSSVMDLSFSMILATAFLIFEQFTDLRSLLIFFTVLFFSILPDLFTIIYLKFPIKFLSLHYDFHYKIHKIIPIHMSYFTATSYQVVLSIGLVVLALLYR